MRGFIEQHRHTHGVEAICKVLQIASSVWIQINREGIAVARCTVERLMRRLGLRGVIRGKVVRTTICDRKAACPLDRLNR